MFAGLPSQRLKQPRRTTIPTTSTLHIPFMARTSVHRASLRHRHRHGASTHITSHSSLPASTTTTRLPVRAQVLARHGDGERTSTGSRSLIPHSTSASRSGWTKLHACSPRSSTMPIVHPPVRDLSALVRHCSRRCMQRTSIIVGCYPTATTCRLSRGLFHGPVRTPDRGPAVPPSSRSTTPSIPPSLICRTHAAAERLPISSPRVRASPCNDRSEGLCTLGVCAHHPLLTTIL